jgi:hypothetical protein
MWYAVNEFRKAARFLQQLHYVHSCGHALFPTEVSANHVPHANWQIRLAVRFPSG